MGKTSIIILTYNQLNYTEQCIESIRTYTKEGTYEIIIVDNHSTDGTVNWLKQQNDLKVIYNDKNLGFPKGCNQGIEIASGDYILLLNNDVIVTENWLNNLLTALESAEDIGAVGPITNSAAYYSTIPVNYNNIEELEQFAEKYNVSNRSKWEERLKLIGFCMLIKREVIDRIGMLDERFSPGNYEDDDFSIRIRQAGYKLIICKDTFIHHYGSVSWKENVSSYARILTDNEMKFREKWGTDSSSYYIHKELIDQINSSKNNSLSVLHIGCLAGATLLEIKNRYNNVNLHGIETKIAEANEAKQIGTIYSTIDDLPSIKFDVILFTDHRLLLTDELLKTIVTYLKDDGVFLSELFNIGNYKIVEQIISGQQLPNDINLYSMSQISNILKLLEIKSEIIGLPNVFDETDKVNIEKLSEIYGGNSLSILNTNLFIIKGRHQNQNLSNLLTKICEKDDVTVELSLLNKYQYNDVFESIIINSDKYDGVVEMLQKIAINNFYHENHEHVLPYLLKAYEIEPTNTDTLYNIAYVLSEYREFKLAYKYLNMINVSDNENIEQLRMLIKDGLNNNTDGIVEKENDENLDDITQIEQNDVHFTGERVVINKHVKQKYRNVMEEHLARYRFASQFVKGKDVLDAACGAGYGTKMLQSADAKGVVGVDVSYESLENAKKTYSGENIEYLYGDVNSLNFKENSFDVVVSFETIEHIKNGYNWIRESARLLRDDGLFVVSTPNRFITNPGSYFDEKPLNPYHEYEYNLQEFVGELLKEYDVIELLGQTFVPDNQSYFNQVMRKIRDLNFNYIPTTYRKYPEHDLLPLKEIKDASPTYIVAVCRKKGDSINFLTDNQNKKL